MGIHEAKLIFSWSARITFRRQCFRAPAMTPFGCNCSRKDPKGSEKSNRRKRLLRRSAAAGSATTTDVQLLVELLIQFLLLGIVYRHLLLYGLAPPESAEKTVERGAANGRWVRWAPSPWSLRGVRH